MRRFILVAIGLLFCLSSWARAAEFELELGWRSFGSDSERWPQVSGNVIFGPERWWVRPVVGGAWSEDPLYGGRISEARLGLAFQLLRRGRSVVQGGAGLAHVDADLGANHGGTEAGYLDLAWRWVRTEAVDLGVLARYVGGSDLVYRSGELLGERQEFREPVSTFSFSFLLHW